MNKLFTYLFRSNITQCASFHSSGANWAYAKKSSPNKFISLNKKIYPPQEIGEEPKPAFVCHQKSNIKYSPEKLWYVASFVRGMTVDEAIKQLSFVNKKGAVFVKEALLEAQDLAVTKHNVEFRSNLWVAESFATKGVVIKGVRRHARKRMGEVRYIYSHYFVKLEEGKPPADYYKREISPPSKQLQAWIEGMRKRKVINSF